MKNWKIGAIAGLIAGIVFGIVSNKIDLPLAVYLGFAQHVSEYFEAPAISFFLIDIFIGTILGVIYSRANRVIPGKAIIKGLLFGLFCILTYNIYFATIFLPYSAVMPGMVLSFIFGYLPSWIAYGIVLGLVYKFLNDKFGILKKEPMVIKYDMRGGVLPGAIAGLLGGAASYCATFFLVYFGLWPLIPRESIDFSFIISQLGTQIMIHLIPGTYLGAIYPRVYNLVPGKGILKGLVMV